MVSFSPIGLKPQHLQPSPARRIFISIFLESANTTPEDTVIREDISPHEDTTPHEDNSLIQTIPGAPRQ